MDRKKVGYIVNYIILFISTLSIPSLAKTSRHTNSHRDHRYQCDHHLGLRQPWPCLLLHHPVPSQRAGQQVRDGGQHYHHPLQHRGTVPQHRVWNQSVSLQQHRPGAPFYACGGPHWRAGPSQPSPKRTGPHYFSEHGDGPLGGAGGTQWTGGMKHLFDLLSIVEHVCFTLFLICWCYCLPVKQQIVLNMVVNVCSKITGTLFWVTGPSSYIKSFRFCQICPYTHSVPKCLHFYL